MINIIPGKKGFQEKTNKIKRELVKRLSEHEYSSIIIERAKNGEEISENDLKYLLNEKLEVVKNFTSCGFFVVIENGIIVNFVDNDNYIIYPTKEYDYDDLEFNDELGCYEL